MKKYWLIMLSAVLVSSSMAQLTEPDALAADKQALRALAATYESAINQGNFSSLQESVSPAASVVFMTGHEVVGLDAMQKYYDEIKSKLGAGSSYSVRLHPDATEFRGDIAIAHGISDERVVFGNGKQINYQSKWTAVLEKKADQWVGIRMHVSIDPLDNPFIRMKNRVSNWTYAVVAGLLGSVIVWLIKRRGS